MAIRFDDRIKTNVAGDVLITGEQIAVSTNNSIIKIGTDETFNINIGGNIYKFSKLSTEIQTVNELPKALANIENTIFSLTTKVIEPAFNDLNNSLNNLGITINTNKKFFGDTLITSTEQLNNYLKNISNKDYTLPLITVLSAPIKLSTDDTENGLYYSTKNDAYYGTDLTVIPKDTLICIMSTNTLFVYDFNSNGEIGHMGVLDENIQILSMPISADSIHNNFETRIANIESLLALK